MRQHSDKHKLRVILWEKLAWIILKLLDQERQKRGGSGKNLGKY